MATAYEAYESRNWASGSTTLNYVILGAAGASDDMAARTALAAAAPASYQGALLMEDGLSIERIAPEGWLGKAVYKGEESPPVKYSFDTTGGTHHILQSLDTVSRLGAGFGQVAPRNFNGLIGVTGDSVTGADIVIPIFKFSETHHILVEELTEAYRGQLHNLTGKVNAAPFRSLRRGEARFDGANGGWESDDTLAEIRFDFAASPNLQGIVYQDFDPIDKEGWHLIWQHFADEVDAEAHAMAKRPDSLYVERVYEYGNFGILPNG